MQQGNGQNGSRARLRAERLNRGLTCAEVADAIGVARTAISRVESGEGMLHPRNAKALADFYGLKVTDLWPEA